MDADDTHPNQTLAVSTQGASVEYGAGVFLFNRSSNQQIWRWTKCPNKCFDIDPVGEDSLLIVSKTSDHKPYQIGGNVSYNWKATHLNWKTGEVKRQFSIPVETHDVDYLGEGRYIIANKIRHDNAEQAWLTEAKRKGWIDDTRESHSHLVYIYNATSDQIVWEYRFQEHFPRTAGDGYEADYTHLNDVDVVQNGSSVLLSPREFDRVLLINKSTKETMWSLGQEDEYDILHEQHNPVVLATDPPTILVADSENDRVVEYAREDGTWNQTWVYSEDLRWPRDADRLPNGNTLIVDTGNDRVIEVTPEGEVVNQTAISQAPYDAEIIGYGDEPGGPTMASLNQTSAESTAEGRSLFERVHEAWLDYHFTASWVLPPWLDAVAFASLHGSVAVLMGGVATEVYRIRRRR
jgi:hypothetical protein